MNRTVICLVIAAAAALVSTASLAGSEFYDSKLTPAIVTDGVGLQSAKIAPGVAIDVIGLESAKIGPGVVVWVSGLNASKLSVGIVMQNTASGAGVVLRAPLTHF